MRPKTSDKEVLKNGKIRHCLIYIIGNLKLRNSLKLFNLTTYYLVILTNKMSKNICFNSYIIYKANDFKSWRLKLCVGGD